jgi:hypothetical protein
LASLADGQCKTCVTIAFSKAWFGATGYYSYFNKYKQKLLAISLNNSKTKGELLTGTREKLDAIRLKAIA